MKIGFIQMTPDRDNPDLNLIKAEENIRAADADLIVLPEFFSTGYLFRDRKHVESVAEEIPNGPITSMMLRLSDECQCNIVAGLPEKSGDIFFNSAVLTSPGGRYEIYRKTHLFDLEKKFFAPGDTGFQVHQIGNVRIGIMICFDWFFPESCRTLALKGADIVAHPSNLVLPWCPKAMETRCLENRVFAITANRAGIETEAGTSLSFIGNSRIISPSGEVIARAENQENVVKTIKIDPMLSRNKSLNKRNHIFNDRRPELYENQEKLNSI